METMKPNFRLVRETEDGTRLDAGEATVAELSTGTRLDRRVFFRAAGGVAALLALLAGCGSKRQKPVAAKRITPADGVIPAPSPEEKSAAPPAPHPAPAADAQPKPEAAAANAAPDKPAAPKKTAARHPKRSKRVVVQHKKPLPKMPKSSGATTRHSGGYSAGGSVSQTQPCGTPIPPGARCRCNCVAY
jgi:hypothetical protein